MRKKLRDMYFPSSSPFKIYIYIYIYINRQVAFLFGQRRFKEVWLIILKSKIIKKKYIPFVINYSTHILGLHFCIVFQTIKKAEALLFIYFLTYYYYYFFLRIKI